MEIASAITVVTQVAREDVRDVAYLRVGVAGIRKNVYSESLRVLGQARPGIPAPLTADPAESAFPAYSEDLLP